MNYKPLGRTGISVSELCFGTMSFGGDADEATSATLYAAAREAGINFFDCANNYSKGAAETIFGGLVASGAHTFAAWARLYLEATPDFATQAGVEMRSVKMVRAVRPGDRLTLKLEITDKRPYPLRPGFGMLDSFQQLFNQDGSRVMTLDLCSRMERRPAALQVS